MKITNFRKSKITIAEVKKVFKDYVKRHPFPNMKQEEIEGKDSHINWKKATEFQNWYNPLGLKLYKYMVKMGLKEGKSMRRGNLFLGAIVGKKTGIILTPFD